jgi:hypothetical protein
MSHRSSAAPPRGSSRNAPIFVPDSQSLPDLELPTQDIDPAPSSTVFTSSLLPDVIPGTPGMEVPDTQPIEEVGEVTAARIANDAVAGDPPHGGELSQPGGAGEQDKENVPPLSSSSSPPAKRPRLNETAEVRAATQAITSSLVKLWEVQSTLFRDAMQACREEMDRADERVREAAKKHAEDIATAIAAVLAKRGE